MYKSTDIGQLPRYYLTNPHVVLTFHERNLIMSLSNRNTRLLFSLLISSSLVAGFIVANPASAAASPVIKVTPSKSLKNGQKIKVSGTGFTPKDSVYIVECLTNAKGQADCNSLGAVPATVDSRGMLPATSFTVTTGAIGAKTCGTSKADANACDISVGNVSGGDSTTGAISFAVKAKK